MGDLRAGTGGSRAAQPTGKRVARHSAEQVSDQPYVGRRVAARSPSSPLRTRPRARVRSRCPSPPASPRADRRAAVPPSFFAEAPAAGRRAMRVDVIPFAMSPAFVRPRRARAGAARRGRQPGSRRPGPDSGSGHRPRSAPVGLEPAVRLAGRDGRRRPPPPARPSRPSPSR